MLFALSAHRSNSQSDFCGKGPLFLERVTCNSYCSTKREAAVMLHEGRMLARGRTPRANILPSCNVTAVSLLIEQ